MTQHVLLVDMDGTLVDTEIDLANSVNFTLEAMGHPKRSREEVRSFVGSGALALLAKALETEDAARLEKAKQTFFAHYDEHLLAHSKPYAGWAAVLASDIPMVCATNKPERFAKKILAGLGLTDRFRLLVGGDSLAVKKPDPAVADYIARQLGVNRNHFIMVGDGVPDAQLAAQCALPFWGARWGYSAEAVLAPYAPLWLERPEDILSRWAELQHAAA